jgi:hypothetical protein
MPLPHRYPNQQDPVNTPQVARGHRALGSTRRGESVGSGKLAPISRKRLPATEQNSKTLRTHEKSDGGALCTVCAYVRSARSMPIQLGRPLSAFPAHTPGHLAHGAKGPKWGFSGGGGMCGCVGYRGVLGCSDHDPASRSSSRRADHSANCRSIRPWFLTQPACTAVPVQLYRST